MRSKGSKSERKKKMNHQRQRMAEDGGGEAIVCNGKSCQSCTAGMIADCIAVCCCPCVVVNILAFAFLKLPWMVARKYLGLGKKRECEMIYGHNGRETYETWEKGTGDEGSLKIVGEEETMNRAFEEEEVWLELYKVGHLGFGRVSFTGIPSQTKMESATCTIGIDNHTHERGAHDE
ncbi:uncharacterized protein LOC111376985 [Olea europaea var. sylvestris]|uniref:uncharacterized protein LOC111376985 n=1 Tax=Olea europaea var. sylvestris TaxID=158386 RepID=UPI000C1D6B09|nr:uncharacterized protein LOC111376985 [Olea europaea var. sylvestris]